MSALDEIALCPLEEKDPPSLRAKELTLESGAMSTLAMRALTWELKLRHLIHLKTVLKVLRNILSEKKVLEMRRHDHTRKIASDKGNTRNRPLQSMKPRTGH